MFGLPRSNDVPDPSQGLRSGTPLHVFKKARHLPQSRPAALDAVPRVAADATRTRAARRAREPNASPLTPPSAALRGSLVLAGVAWLGAAAAELLGTRLLAFVGLGLGGFALRWSFERPRHRGWWLLAATGVFALARVVGLLAAL